jgi:hypothetical protein
MPGPEMLPYCNYESRGQEEMHGKVLAPESVERRLKTQYEKISPQTRGCTLRNIRN